MTTTLAEIEEGFQEFDIKIDVDEVGDKLLDISCAFGLDVDTLVNEWLAYQSRNKQCCMNSSNLEIFDRYLRGAKGRNNAPLQSSNNVNSRQFMSPPSKMSIGEENVITALTYCTPDNRDKFEKNAQNMKSPDAYPNVAMNTPAKSFASSALLTPNLSPFQASMSKTFSSRSNSGEVVSALHESDKHEKLQLKQRTKTVRNLTVCSHHLKMQSPYCYMFQKIVDLSDVMNDAIETSAEIIMQNNSNAITGYFPCTEPSQSVVTIVGRVTSEAGCKLTANSVVLQGDRVNSFGRSVCVDISNLHEGCFFRGQVVALAGTNPTGNKFVATEMFTQQSQLGRLMASDSVDLHTTHNVVSFLIASGPFTTSDSLSYEPLLEFISVVKQQTPDVTIFIGPLIDETHKEIENPSLNEAFSDLSQSWIAYIINQLQTYTKVVFLPAQRDVFHQPVYPQPPYASPMPVADVHFLSDPCTFTVEGAVIGATSTDILLHLGAEEFSCGSTSVDRRTRLMSHLIDNQTYYPLYPAHESVCVDWISAEQGARISTGNMPDILVVSSDLRFFVKCVNGRLYVNPGRLAKGLGGGTYAHVSVDVSSKDKLNCSAHIVRI